MQRRGCANNKREKAGARAQTISRKGRARNGEDREIIPALGWS